MPLKPRRETPIERIYREVTGKEMPAEVKRELLPKRRPSDNEWNRQWGESIMLSDDWIKTLADGRRVKFTNQDCRTTGGSSPLKLKATKSFIRSC
jgi:hypothetical protein